MSQHKRSRLFVDYRVQGALMARTIAYWGMCLLSLALLLFCWRIYTGPALTFAMHLRQMWEQFGPAILASALILPLLVVDAARLSNRFAGPLYRVRLSLAQLAAGERIPVIQFRDGDYWPEIADDINKIAARLAAQNQLPVPAVPEAQPSVAEPVLSA